jgi:hypothetical protein
VFNKGSGSEVPETAARASRPNGTANIAEQQDQDHPRLAQQKSGDARMQQLEQRHQQQTHQLPPRQAVQM